MDCTLYIFQGTIVKDKEEFSQSFYRKTLDPNAKKIWRRFTCDILRHVGPDGSDIPDWIDEAPGQYRASFDTGDYLN